MPSEYAGKAIEVFGSAGGEMADMFQRGDQTHLVFKIPSRGTMGLRTRLLNVTRGEATMFHHFSEYGPYRGEFGGRKNGSLISMSTEKSVAYALDALQERGKLFVGPGEDCYEGMIVGQSAKEGDMVVNIAKSKQLGNQRSWGEAIQLTPRKPSRLRKRSSTLKATSWWRSPRRAFACASAFFPLPSVRRPTRNRLFSQGSSSAVSCEAALFVSGFSLNLAWGL